MIRQLCLASMVCVIHVCAAGSSLAQSAGETLIGEDQAARVGLARGWVAQLPLDRARTKIKSIAFHDDLLTAVGSDGMLHVVDAGTGQLKWSMLVGDPRFQTLTATASPAYVTAVNNTHLYVMDRDAGSLVISRALTGTPACQPTLLQQQVVVPLVNGPVEVYPLAAPSESVIRPQYLPSFSRAVRPPIASGNILIWADSTHLYGQQFAAAGFHYSRRVPGEIVSGPVGFSPNVYVGTAAGYVHAYDAHSGEKRWSFAAGSPVYENPAALGMVVYVLPQDGGMFAVNADTGEQLWYAPDPARFVSASPALVYTLDRFGLLTIIDAKNGALAGVMPLLRRIKPLANEHTDRLLLYTDSGFIQCLHEARRSEPHRWLPAEPVEKPKPPNPDEVPPSEAAAPVDGGA